MGLLNSTLNRDHCVEVGSLFFKRVTVKLGSHSTFNSAQILSNLLVSRATDRSSGSPATIRFLLRSNCIGVDESVRGFGTVRGRTDFFHEDDLAAEASILAEHSTTSCRNSDSWSSELSAAEAAFTAASAYLSPHALQNQLKNVNCFTTRRVIPAHFG